MIELLAILLLWRCLSDNTEKYSNNWSPSLAWRHDRKQYPMNRNNFYANESQREPCRLNRTWHNNWKYPKKHNFDMPWTTWQGGPRWTYYHKNHFNFP